MYFTNTKRLNNSAGVPITQLAMLNTVLNYSEAIKVDKNVGFFVLLAKEDAASTTGDVDIYAEYSIDGTNWYRANTTSGGTLTQESNIVTALANTTKWIVFTARLANFVRIVVDPDADSRVTLDFLYQEDV
jgi:hypothetical protein